MRNRTIAAASAAALATIIAGCASNYVSPPSGPETAEITVTFTDYRSKLAKFVSIFDDPFECRSWKRIAVDRTLTSTIVVPARSTTLQLLSAGGYMGYQTIMGQRCDIIVSFEPMAGRKYSISHVDYAEGCRVQMISEFNGVRRDETESLTKRAVIPLDKLKGHESRPRLCYDTYKPNH